MRFGYTIVYVPEVEGAVRFYEAAFGLARRFVHESGTYAELETGATTLSFAAETLAEGLVPGGFRRNEPDRPPAGIEICFLTDDVPAAYARALAAGAAPVAEPATKPWGQIVAYVRDANGVLVELATPVGG